MEVKKTASRMMTQKDCFVSPSNRYVITELVFADTKDMKFCRQELKTVGFVYEEEGNLTFELLTDLVKGKPYHLRQEEKVARYGS